VLTFSHDFELEISSERKSELYSKIHKRTFKNIWNLFEVFNMREICWKMFSETTNFPFHQFFPKKYSKVKKLYPSFVFRAPPDTSLKMIKNEEKYVSLC